MPDIGQPETVKTVERRLEGKGQGSGRQSAPEQPPKKIVENYAEAARGQPADDRITILGIPVEQITPATQAALGGLVSEVNHLRNVVKRLERMTSRAAPQAAPATTPVLEPDAFFRALSSALVNPPSGSAWIVVLVHVATYEDIRRSSGLLAANSVLADVAHRLRDVPLSGAPESPATDKAIPSGAAPSLAGIQQMPFSLLGYVGGSNLAGLASLPAGAVDTVALARTVRAHLATGGYNVAGIDMALAISVSAAAVGAGESAQLALGRADHVLRTGTA
jgi:hypothetical protein